MVHVITFATSDLIKSAKRLKKQSESFSVIESFAIFSEDSLLKNEKVQKIISQHSRGFGLWSWKPFIIQQALQNIPTNSNLLYLDVGCELNPHGLQNLKQYLSDLKHSRGILPFRAVPPGDDIRVENFHYEPLIERMWSKQQLLTFLELEDDHCASDSPQFGAGIIFLRNNDFTRHFISQWRSIMENYPDLYDDISFIEQQSPDFIQSRHDQSVFSLLCKSNNLDKYRSAYEYFHPRISPFWAGITIGDWKRLQYYPILAKRNKDYGFLRNILRLNFPVIKSYVKALLNVLSRW